MAAPAANEAQPQGPQVPRAPQAIVVQDIVAEQPPAQPILDANELEVMCLPFFSYFTSIAAAFHVHVSVCSYLYLPCVSSHSVHSPLHLACFLLLAPFSSVFNLHSLVLPYCNALSFQASCSSF